MCSIERMRCSPATIKGGELGRLASLVETCKLNGVDPQAYLADVLQARQWLAASRIDELMPWAWAASRTTNRLAA